MSSYSDGGAPVVAIVGTGFSGLCAGPNLAKKLGLENFVIFEKSNGIGGTWRHQRYPGAACDVAAHAYSLSFELNPEWSCEFPPRTEIKSYMEHVFDKYNVGKYVRFNTEILSARWNEQDGLWELHWREFAPPKTQEEIDKVEGEGQWGQLAQREIVGEGVFKANIFYNSSGPFTRPYAPNYPGVDLFQGQYIHTIEWDDTVPLKDKRVAVIGTGPSGLQVVSQVVHEARQLDVYQRTAAWVFPWGNAPFTDEQKALWRSDVKALEAKRQSLMDAGNGLWVTIENPDGETHANLKTALLGYLSSTCKKPGLYEKLVPNFPIGCKRFLIDCNYLDALNKDNCDLIVDSIDHVTERGIVGRDKITGKEIEREYDVIIWATGWGSFAFGRAFPVYGVAGQELWDYWRKVGNPSAYLGAMSNSFPNMIYTCGPNGSTFDSFVEMIEIRVDFMVRAIKELQRRNAQWLMPKLAYELGWTRIVNEAGRVSPFGGSCISYYKFTWEAWDEAGTSGGGHIGKQKDKYQKFSNPGFYPGTTNEYRSLLEDCNMDEAFEYGEKKGTWELPDPPKEPWITRQLRPKVMRDGSESLVAKLVAEDKDHDLLRKAFAGLFTVKTVASSA